MYLIKLITQSFRMIKAYRLYSIVNIVGLALGLACTIIISKYIFREVTVDHFHKDYDRICTYEFNRIRADANKIIRFGTTMIPEIQSECSIKLFPDYEVSVSGSKYQVNVMASDSSFFKTFDFPLQVGDPDHILDGTDQVIVTQQLARRLFGDENPLGKVITIFQKPAVIAGIFAEFPGKSMFVFDMVVSMPLTSDVPYYNAQTFYKHYPNTNLDSLNNRYSDVDGYAVRFLSLEDMYKYGLRESTDSLFLQGNPSTIRVLGLVALAVLLIGVFNFINIYTVTLLRRGKEIGIKKVFGVGNMTILNQLICENIIMVCAAVVIALLLVVATAGWIYDQWGLEIVSTPSFDIPLIVGLLVFIPIVTTIYPYLKHRFASPVTSIKSLAHRGGSFVSRALFMVAQYVMTTVLILVALFFTRQLYYMLGADWGYNTQHIIQTKFLPPQDVKMEKTDFMKHVDVSQSISNELNQNTQTLHWTSCESPTEWNRYMMTIYFKSETSDGEFLPVSRGSVNQSFMDIFEIELLEGRVLVDSLDCNYAGLMGIMLNQKAQKLLNVEVGDVIECQSSQTFTMPDKSTEQWIGDSRRYRVEGIVKNVSYCHLSQEITPMAMLCSGNYVSHNSWVSVRYQEGEEQEIIASLQQIYKKVTPEGEFRYRFIRDEADAIYAEDRRVTSIYGTFALIAILISSLGLFSLSIYDVQQRYREIALRKVHGATVWNVLCILTMKYYGWLLVAFVIAMPIAWYAITKYLENFVVKAPLSWWIFVAAALITAAISLLTLWWQTYRAATENPAKAMKSE